MNADEVCAWIQDRESGLPQTLALNWSAGWNAGRATVAGYAQGYEDGDRDGYERGYEDALRMQAAQE